MDSGLQLFGRLAAAVCIVMCVVWLRRYKARGPQAIVMAVAFVLLGVLFWLFQMGAPDSVLISGGAFLVVLLILDAILRSAKRKGGGS